MADPVDFELERRIVFAEIVERIEAPYPPCRRQKLASGQIDHFASSSEVIELCLVQGFVSSLRGLGRICDCLVYDIYSWSFMGSLLFRIRLGAVVPKTLLLEAYHSRHIGVTIAQHVIRLIWRNVAVTGSLTVGVISRHRCRDGRHRLLRTCHWRHAVWAG